MSLTFSENDLDYFQREMSYLRRMIAIYAKQYPKVAQRLQIGEGASGDPHVERLIESFAFLTGNLQQTIDNEFPRFTTALLGVLYSQFVNPTPSMSVARFAVDTTQGKMTSGYTVEKETPLFTHASEGNICRFQTSYPVELWPIEVYDADLVQADDYDFVHPISPYAKLLRIRLRSMKGDLNELELKKLRFHINADEPTALVLYESIFTGEGSIAIVSDESKSPVVIPQGSLGQVGFADDEGVIPASSHGHPAYRFLQEYFVFPNKFMFFDVDNLDQRTATKTVDILLPVSNLKALEKVNLGASNFLLGCTPIINLFKKISEPIRLDHRKSEYHLVGDLRRELTNEIHTITKVVAATAGETAVEEFTPYFSFSHDAALEDQKAFWYARRSPAIRKDMPGTDLFLSFVDFSFNPMTPAVQTVFAHTMCTNRLLPIELPAGAKLQIEKAAPAAEIYCLNAPTLPIYPPSKGATGWKLISQLTLNQLSFSSDPKSLEALKELLRLYVNIGGYESGAEIDAMKKLECEPTVRRLGQEAWRGFVRGTAATVTFDGETIKGHSPVLFSGVLNNFFRLYVSINSFVELSIKRTAEEGIWKTWPAHVGGKALL